MRIEYENKLIDVLIFNAAHQLLSLPVQIFYILAAVGITISELFKEPDNPFLTVLTGCIAYIFMWVVQLFFNAIYLYYKKDKSILTNHIIEVQADTLYEETQYSRSYFYWHGVHKVVRRGGYIAVYVTKHMAHIIPGRTFDSKQQRNEFFELVNSKIQK